MDHMSTEHDVRRDADMEVLLVITLMTAGERSKLRRDYSQKVSDRLKPQAQKTVPLSRENDDEEEVGVQQNGEVEVSEDENAVYDSEKIIISDDEEDVGDERANSPAPEPAKKIEREGVLKCKFCAKYIKQSQMTDHKRNIHPEEAPPSFTDSERLLLEPSDRKLNETTRLNHSQKRKVNEDSDNDCSDDDGDEDWSFEENMKNEMARKKRQMLPCRYCKRRFGSKMTLTQHERTSHSNVR